MLQHHSPTATLPKRVVILGSSGFVGRYLLLHLGELGIPAVGFSSSELNLLNPEAIATLQQTLTPDDALVIISALTPDRGRDIRTLMQNLTMVENVCTVLENTPLSQVIYISSDAVYSDHANPVREDSCCDPSGFHGVMHLARERMISYALRSGKTPLLILRPSLLYGPGDTHNGYGPNRFLRTALQDGKITLFGNGEEKRDHIYIKDVSKLIGLGLVHRSAGVLNVATGNAVPFMETAQIIAGLKGGVEIECLPRSNPITHRHFDITATHKSFPEFHYTSIQDGLTATYQDVTA